MVTFFCFITFNYYINQNKNSFTTMLIGYTAINKKTKEKIEFFCIPQLAEQEYRKNCPDFSNWYYGANGKFKFN